MKEIDARKRVVTYVILTFVLSAPFYYLVRQNGGLEGGGATICVSADVGAGRGWSDHDLCLPA